MGNWHMDGRVLITKVACNLILYVGDAYSCCCFLWDTISPEPPFAYLAAVSLYWQHLVTWLTVTIIQPLGHRLHLFLRSYSFVCIFPLTVLLHHLWKDSSPPSWAGFSLAQLSQYEKLMCNLWVEFPSRFDLDKGTLYVQTFGMQGNLSPLTKYSFLLSWEILDWCGRFYDL